MDPSKKFLQRNTPNFYVFVQNIFVKFRRKFIHENFAKIQRISSKFPLTKNNEMQWLKKKKIKIILEGFLILFKKKKKLGLYSILKSSTTLSTRSLFPIICVYFAVYRFYRLFLFGEGKEGGYMVKNYFGGWKLGTR